MSTPPPPAHVKVDPLPGLRARLIRAIFAMSEKSHSATRSILDGYGRHVNPSAASAGVSLLPHNPRPHHLNPERTSNFSSVAVMLSLVGIAVTGYYNAVLGKDGAVAVLEKRVAFLEQAAKWRKYKSVGGDAVGFTIEEVPETVAERTQREKDKKNA